MIIITTVGTSLLSNLLKEDVKGSFNYSLSSSTSKKIQNNSLRRENLEVASAINEVILGNEDFPIDEKYELNLSASAEIKSICKIADGTPAKVYLLATDTFMSGYAAKQIAEHLNGKNGLTVKNKGCISGLRIDAPEEFEQSGFEELIKVLDSIRQSHQDDEVILNISGGYKALIPFLTIYAQLESLPIKYIYENSDEVISIGRTPLNFDWDSAEAYYEYLQNPDLLTKAPIELTEAMEKNGLITEDNSFTPLGRMLKRYIGKHLPQRSDVLGWYMEHKLFESFFRKPYREFQVSSLGREFFYDPQVPCDFFEEKKKGLARIEIDVELKNDQGYLFWIECKSFSKRGKAIDQVKKALEFNSKYLKASIKNAGVFIYKYSFQKLPEHFYQNLADELLNEYGARLSVFIWDIPYSFQKNNINYKNIFEAKLEFSDFEIIQY